VLPFRARSSGSEAGIVNSSSAAYTARSEHEMWLETKLAVISLARGACLLAGALAAVLSGCATPSRQSDTLAARAGFTRTLLEGGRFHLVSYERSEPGGRLVIFIEGDGTPWIHSGRVVAADPTSRRPLALELATESVTTASAGSVLYLGRPCYLGLAASGECEPADWTSSRYSAEVVQSLAEAANGFIAEHGFQQVVLIGHSGGGALAMLMAPRLIRLSAVITIAGNLNVAAWSQYHRYLPLTGSLDPAAQPPLHPGIREIHLVGGADRNIPPALLVGYLATHPAAKVWTFPAFGHLCCWRNAWPTVFPRLLDAALK
jgi:hypothetical protein